MTGAAVERTAIGRALRLGVPVAILLAAASSPAIAQWVPRFFFPMLRTIYCHLSTRSVMPGQTVARGQRLGSLGTSGQRAWPGYEHVHLELQRGNDPSDLHDPASRMAGCFEEARPYPTDRLVLTYPVRC